MEDIAIKVDSVSKSFKLPHEKTGSVKNAFIGLFSGKRTYEKQEVLKDVSFDIKKGEFFGIVGRNGSGKSTLLKLLARIYSPDTGNVQVNGKLTPFIELGVGFNPELTGRENVYLNGALLGFSRKEMESMYDEIVEFAELKKFMDQKLKNYSSGMQVRLAFSVAIRAETDILLIDEVLAVGDQSFQEKCFRYFAELKKSPKTIIFVTHDMSNVEKFCDRVFVLDKKKENTGLYSIPEAVVKYNELNHPSSKRKLTHDARKNQDLSIAKVELLNKELQAQDKFAQFDPMTIRVHLAFNSKKLKKEDVITLGLAFHDAENVNLAGPNSSQQKYSLNSKFIDYKIKRIPFNMGEYKLTVALFDEYAGKQHDIINEGISFFVNTKDVQYGKITLDASWEAQE